ncbi:MAG TPA: acylphosphatase [Holophagaceae bacterium]|nr:acylphosphatase [Holophagaceae bacterium]
MKARFRVQGLVQGVGYRSWVQFRAVRLRLSGWIGNEADGAVAGEVEGGAESLATFKELLALGPELAKVRLLQWDLDKGADPAGESLPFPFEIRR